jgi:hypothetical protein
MKYFETLGKIRGKNAERRLRFQMWHLYKTLDFKGKVVLDIGGGDGLHSFYALSQGARSAVVLEPEGDGGDTEMNATLLSLQRHLGESNIVLMKETFQKFEAKIGSVDLVIIHDAINHLDEQACITLRRSVESREKYDMIFRKLSTIIVEGGFLVIADCSPNNIFPAIGLRNPFDPNIQWEKHQAPDLWFKLASKFGFTKTRLDWSTPSILGKYLGPILNNEQFAWFYTSHFQLILQKAKL